MYSLRAASEVGSADVAPSAVTANNLSLVKESPHLNLKCGTVNLYELQSGIVVDFGVVREIFDWIERWDFSAVVE